MSWQKMVPKAGNEDDLLDLYDWEWPWWSSEFEAHDSDGDGWGDSPDGFAGNGDGYGDGA
jgi:hypothetical protein